MFKILVTVINLATGAPVAMLVPGDTFETLKDCEAFLAAEAPAVTKQFEAAQPGFTITGRCVMRSASKQVPV